MWIVFPPGPWHGHAAWPGHGIGIVVALGVFADTPYSGSGS